MPNWAAYRAGAECPECGNTDRQTIAENCAPKERARARAEGWLTFACEACDHQWDVSWVDDAKERAERWGD